MKSYTLIAIVLLVCGLTGAGLSFTFLESAAQFGGASISMAVFCGPAGSFFFKRKFDKREINFIKEKN